MSAEVWAKPLHERIERTSPLINARTARDYLDRALRPRLNGVIAPRAISQHVRVTSDGLQIIGGQIDQGRNPALAQLHVEGGGWITFSVTVEPTNEGLELRGYVFERVFPSEAHVRFIRFDLNPEGHANDTRELRSHMHPGHDDWMLPAPILAPHELLHVMLTKFGARGERSERSKGRGTNS